MHYEVHPNHKHESWQRTALLEQITGHNPDSLNIVVTPGDAIEAGAPVELANFRIPAHYLRHCHAVIYHDRAEGEVKVIWTRSK